MGDSGLSRAIQIFVCVLAVLPAPTYAQAVPARPWAAGVSESEQATALELYDEGNREFGEARFAQALAKYKEALRHWDHPAIRFNIAVCLLHLDQPLEAKHNLERSLVYGEGSLGAELYGQGLRYRKSLDGQLAFVKISCQEAGTQVTLDGKLLLTGPGTVDEILLPGEHHLAATKTGFLTVARTLVLAPGERMTTIARMIRRWDPWRPLVVLAGGGALVGLGVLSYVAAVRGFADYDGLVHAQCPRGCSADMRSERPAIGSTKERAQIEGVFGVLLLSAGSAVVLAGFIGLIMNEPRLELETNHAQPVIAATHGGATITMSWGF